MRRTLHILSCLALLLAGGCTYFTGVSVAFNPDAAEAIRQDLQEFLAASGYDVRRRDGESIVVYQHCAHELHAVIRSHADGMSFAIGKTNSKKFSSEEIAQVDKFALWIVSRSESILRGQASKTCTTKRVREHYYEKIRKP